MDILENILSTIGWFLVGVVAGRMILRWLVLPVLQARRDREDQEIAQLEQRVHIVKQEVINDIIYWYDNDDGAFLAQGRDHDQIVAVLEQRFPQHIFVINETQMIMGPKFNEVIQFDELKIQREN
jgi:hypothetical protein